MGAGARWSLGLAASAVVVTAGFLVFGGASESYPQYAKYRHGTAARAQSEALLATIPVYPGARAVQRDFTATAYYVGKNYETIEAEPYSLAVQYLVPGGSSGLRIMRFYRRALPGRGWQCEFTPRVRGSLRSFSCRRGHQVIGAFIPDSRGYSLSVQVSDVVPPIKQVPQVE